MSANIAVIGVNLGRMQLRGPLLRAELDEIFRMYAAGKIKPVIGKIFSAGGSRRGAHLHSGTEKYRQGHLDREMTGASIVNSGSRLGE